MTVAELIGWLRTQDQEATVMVIRHERGSGYYDQGGSASVVRFDPAPGSDTNQWCQLWDHCRTDKWNELLLGVLND